MSETSLTDLQTDLWGRSMADEILSVVATLIEDKADIASEVAKALGPLSAGQTAKVGACILVRMPTADDDMPDVYFSPLDSKWTFTVIENPVINRDVANGGTGLRALTIARRVHRVFKNYIPGGLAQNLVPTKPCITPNDDFSPLPAYDVNFQARESDPTNYQRCATPVIAPAGGVTPIQVTVTCATAGVTLRGTLDGSHPWAGVSPGPFGFIINGPFMQNTPGTLRVAANKAGLIDSDVAAAIFT